MNGTAARPWPDKATALETFGEQTQTVTVPPQNLNPITAPATKHKQLTRERILRESSLHESGQAIETITQIGDSAREPHARAAGQSDHRVAANTSRSITPSTIPHTRMRRFDRSISIVPSAGAPFTRTAAKRTGAFLRFGASTDAAYRRRGIGSALLATLHGRLDQLDVREIDATFPDDAALRALLTARGYGARAVGVTFSRRR